MRRHLIFEACVLVLVGVLAYVFLFKPPSGETDGFREIAIRGTTIAVEVVDTPLERSQGLSGRDGLLDHHGMLFVFESPQSPGFWMKDMRFPIDIIWIDVNGKVIGISPDLPAPKENEAPKEAAPPGNILYALEIDAGRAATYGWKVGDAVSFR